jgi:hypothetical protein
LRAFVVSLSVLPVMSHGQNPDTVVPGVTAMLPLTELPMPRGETFAILVEARIA